MTLRELVAEALARNRFEGLVNEWGQCGCGLDDLMPCDGQEAQDCVGAHKVACDADCEHDDDEDNPLGYHWEAGPRPDHTEEAPSASAE